MQMNMQDAVLGLFLEHYGKGHQMLKCVEEMTELSEKLIKYFTKHEKCDSEIIYEMADVFITLRQAMLILNVSDGEMEQIIYEKICRQFGRIMIEYGQEEENKNRIRISEAG